MNEQVLLSTRSSMRDYLPKHLLAMFPFVLAALLVVSGGLKLEYVRSHAIAAFGLFNSPQALMWIATVELLVAFLVLLPNTRRCGLPIAAFCFICFSGYQAFNLISGRAEPCHCFGRLSMSPVSMLAIDLFVVGSFACYYRSETLQSGAMSDRISTLASFVCGLAALCTPQWAAIRPNQSPSDVAMAVTADAERFDFGTLYPVDCQKTHSFRLTNQSAQVVRIDRIATSCGCTKITTQLNEIPPLGSIMLPVQVEWAQQVGPQQELVEVALSQNGKSATLRLRVAGNVYIPIRVSATSLDFGHVQVGRTATRTLRIGVAPHEPAVSILSASFDGGEGFSIPQKAHTLTLPMQISPHSVLELPLEFTAKKGEGSHISMLRLSTDSPTNPEITIALKGHVLGE